MKQGKEEYKNGIGVQHYQDLIFQRYNIGVSDAVPLDVVSIIDSTSFLQAIKACFVSQHASDFIALRKFNKTVILDYLKRTHTLYLEKRLPEIEQSIFNLYHSSNTGGPLIAVLYQSFVAYTKELKDHIEHEEQTLFQLSEGEEKLSDQQLNSFIHEHTDTNVNLERIRKILEAAISLESNKSHFRVLIAQLETFELDLKVHALIEEQVLIPMLK